MVLEYSRTLVLEYSTLVGESPEWMLKVRGVNRCAHIRHIRHIHIREPVAYSGRYR